MRSLHFYVTSSHTAATGGIKGANNGLWYGFPTCTRISTAISVYGKSSALQCTPHHGLHYSWLIVHAATNHDATRNDAATNHDAAWHDAAGHDATRNDAARNDATRNDAVRNDAAWHDAAWNDAIRNDAIRNDAAWNDAAWNDAIRNDAAWHDAAGHDATWNDAIRNDAEACGYEHTSLATAIKHTGTCDLTLHMGHLCSFPPHFN